MILFPRSIGPIPVDAVISEVIESRLRITELPVEFGADITDHAYVEPKRITIEGVIGGSTSRSSSGGRAVAVAGWQALKSLQASRVPFTLVSGLDVHRNILIESISAERDKDYSMVLKFTAELREIQIVGSAYTAGVSGAPDGGQAKNLTGKTLTPGDTTIKGSPDVIRGDISTTTTTTGTINTTDTGSILYGLVN